LRETRIDADLERVGWKGKGPHPRRWDCIFPARRYSQSADLQQNVVSQLVAHLLLHAVHTRIVFYIQVMGKGRLDVDVFSKARSRVTRSLLPPRHARLASNHRAPPFCHGLKTTKPPR